MTQQQSATQEHVLPYRHWWGLLGCAALMGVIFAAGPYSEGLVLEPDRGDMWYFWQRADEPTVNGRASGGMVALSACTSFRSGS